MARGARVSSGSRTCSPTRSRGTSGRSSSRGRRSSRGPWNGGDGMAQTKHGFLVLVDISGFTAFVTATELEHGPPIIGELLEAVIGRIAPPLAVQGIEGDAVFALGPHGHVLPPASLLAVLHAGFLAFRERQRALEADDSCSCHACRSVGQLRLKAIGHYGTFLEYTVGGLAQTAGPDVILAHRLLKNAVPQKGDY